MTSSLARRSSWNLILLRRLAWGRTHWDLSDPEIRRELRLLTFQAWYSKHLFAFAVAKGAAFGVSLFVLVVIFLRWWIS